MKQATKNKLKYKSKALVRSKSAFAGCLKILQLVERAGPTENTLPCVANNDGVLILQHVRGNF